MGNGVSPGIKLFANSEESPTAFQSHIHNSLAASPRGKMPRYRSMLSNFVSPLTPSFGILPLESNTPEPMMLPSHATLAEANDQKSLAKRVSGLKAPAGVSKKKTYMPPDFGMVLRD